MAELDMNKSIELPPLDPFTLEAVSAERRSDNTDHLAKRKAAYADMQAAAIARGPLLKWGLTSRYSACWEAHPSTMSTLRVRVLGPCSFHLAVRLSRTGALIAEHEYRGDIVNAFAICEELLRMNALQLIGADLYYAPR